jgi:hypothetical protein
LHSNHSSRVQYRKDYLNPSGEVIFSQANAERIVNAEPEHAIVVTTQYHTKQAKDAYRPPGEEGLPPPVMSTGSTLIEIKSRAVIHAIRTVVGYYPEARFTGDTISILEPFPLLYHYREELQAYRDDFAERDQDCCEDPNVVADIKTLLDLFEGMCGQNVRDELGRGCCTNQESTSTVT